MNIGEIHFLLRIDEYYFYMDIISYPQMLLVTSADREFVRI